MLDNLPGPPSSGSPRLVASTVVLQDVSDAPLVWIDRLLQWNDGLDLRLNVLLTADLAAREPDGVFPDFREHSIDPQELVRVIVDTGQRVWASAERDWKDRERLHVYYGKMQGGDCVARYWAPGLTLVGEDAESTRISVAVVWEGAGIDSSADLAP